MACITLTGKERFVAHEPTGESVPAHGLHAGFDEAAAEVGEQVVSARRRGPPIDEDGGAREMDAEGALADPAPTMVFGMHVTPYPKGVVAYLAGTQYGASVLETGVRIHANVALDHLTGAIPVPG